MFIYLHLFIDIFINLKFFFSIFPIIIMLIYFNYPNSNYHKFFYNLIILYFFRYFYIHHQKLFQPCYIQNLKNFIFNLK
jgi:hypothetical protein